MPTTTPQNAATAGDWLWELVAGIMGATSLVEGQVNRYRPPGKVGAQRAATVEGSGERIPFLGQEPGCPRFKPVAAILASAVTVGIGVPLGFPFFFQT
ncbi:unnamed protein product [Lampetra fluviatilis]